MASHRSTAITMATQPEPRPKTLQITRAPQYQRCMLISGKKKAAYIKINMPSKAVRSLADRQFSISLCLWFLGCVFFFFKNIKANKLPNMPNE